MKLRSHTEETSELVDGTNPFILKDMTVDTEDQPKIILKKLK